MTSPAPRSRCWRTAGSTNTRRLTIAELFDVLLKAEILQAFGSRHRTAQGRQGRLAAAAAPSSSAKPAALPTGAPQLDDRLFSLTIMDLCDRLRLMFFGNLYQDWSEFVLADLGHLHLRKSRVLRRLAGPAQP